MKASVTTPHPPPAHKEIGFITSILDKALASGPAGLRKAQRVAIKFARKFQAETEDHFKKRTKFLNQWFDSNDPNARACARYALVWRPKFLSGLSLTYSPTLAARFARISKQTVFNHRKWDSEFAAQWQEAVEHAIELLHSRCFQRALEGDCEPVFYMGKPVGYVRKFDSRLQIELLRAYRPDKFKTPGGTNVNVGAKGDVFVLTEDQRHVLMDYYRNWLLSQPPSETGAACPDHPPRELGDAGCADPHNTAPTTYDEKVVLTPPKND